MSCFAICVVLSENVRHHTSYLPVQVEWKTEYDGMYMYISNKDTKILT